MRANAYIYDDLEVNANSSSVLLNGQYYGYNYASTDNRTYTQESIEKGSREFTKYTNEGITDGKGIEGQSHYNSSAIILNGENTTLDFSRVEALYVAGQSYIEVSKDVKETESTETVTYQVQNAGELTDEVKKEVTSYPTPKREDGKITDNYTIDNDNKTPYMTPIQDYRTGEAISIKSNQLAYIPNWAVHDQEDGLYLSLPQRLRDIEAYQGIWANFDKIPVIKTVISGKKYYFLDFSKADLKDTNVMNQFIADYAALFDISTADEDTGLTKGEAYGLMDITNYDYFQVEMLQVTDDPTGETYNNIYTNSAITSKVGDSFTIVANSNNIAPLVKAAENISDAVDAGNNVTTKVEKSDDASVYAARVSSKLQDQYKEMKWLLTKSSTNGDYVTEAHTLKEDVITPINHYFDFDLVNADNSKYCSLDCGYGVWVSDGDVVVGATSYKIGTGVEESYTTPYAGGKVRGIILAKGEVSFKDDVEEFEGLIVTGGKIIVNNFDRINNKTTMSFMANEEIIKTILRECDASRGNAKSKNFGFVCDIFRLFQSQYVSPEESDETPIISMRDVSAVQFEDILSFRNWKKNVD